MKFVLLFAFLIFTGIGYWLRYLNLSYLRLHGHKVPPEFAGAVDPATLTRITDYTLENSRFGLVASVLDNILLITFLFGGLLPVYDRWIMTLTPSFIFRGILFMLFLIYAQTLLDIPFTLYQTFRIENKYGFNTTNFRLWLTDLLKGLVIGTAIGTIVVSGALQLVAWCPASWWFWVWLFFLCFSISIMYVSPYIIEPLFFRFEPVKIEGLEERIKGLMAKAGLRVSRVFQVDASRRSRHSNAYFTGIGRVKRIVLFDTLLAQMTPEEILAVLAHEVGHWKKKHILKRIVVMEALSLLGLYLFHRLLQGTWLIGLVGHPEASFYAKVAFLVFLAMLVAFPLTPLANYLSRRAEWTADRFAVELTSDAGAMAGALVKLSKENLSNLHPHPLYAAFYYGHPPPVERIRSLRGFSADKK